jgi:glutamyl/glutaminyl-tRNA synthetase
MQEKIEKKIFRELCMVMRVAITGKDKGPSLFEIMEILGKEECIRRIEECI